MTAQNMASSLYGRWTLKPNNDLKRMSSFFKYFCSYTTLCINEIAQRDSLSQLFATVENKKPLQLYNKSVILYELSDKIRMTTKNGFICNTEIYKSEAHCTPLYKSRYVIGFDGLNFKLVKQKS